MSFISRLLPLILPLAVRWADEQEALILKEGVPLSATSLTDATTIGVLHPEKIRLLKVARVPMPVHPLLRQAGKATGLISPQTSGMSLRYGIFVREDCWDDRRLIAHECVHTAQYERLGGIRPFLEKYLLECMEIGYPAAPMEQEAIDCAASLTF